MDSKEQLNLVKRIKAIADTGLVYAESGYDLERYEELKRISLALMGHLSNEPFSVIASFFLPPKDYPTPKVDVRGFVVNADNEILMAKESVDDKWTIPGGWADIGHSPSEVVVREIKEETGIDAKVVRLMAVYDKQRHDHPPEPYYIYKLMYLCEAVGGTLEAGFDMKGAAYFSLAALPELSEDRVLKSQLQHLFRMYQENSKDVYSD